MNRISLSPSLSHPLSPSLSLSHPLSLSLSLSGPSPDPDLPPTIKTSRDQKHHICRLIRHRAPPTTVLLLHRSALRCCIAPLRSQRLSDPGASALPKALSCYIPLDAIIPRILRSPTQRLRPTTSSMPQPPSLPLCYLSCRDRCRSEVSLVAQEKEVPVTLRPSFFLPHQRQS